MITTYAISLTADDCTDSDRIRLVDLVSDWLVDEYPPEERPPGMYVRVREGANDPVFRISIIVNTPGASHSTATDITVVMNMSSLTFDIRSVTLPMSQRITRIHDTPVPPNLVHLVQRVLRAIPVYDANRLVTADTEIIRDALGGQSVGAMLVSAPGRNLPVLIEVRDFERNSQALLAKGTALISGLVHSFCLDTADAVRGFIDITGESLVSPGSIYLYWAGSLDPITLSSREMPQASVGAEVMNLANRIVRAGASSLAPPRVPPPPVDTDSAQDEDLHLAYDMLQRQLAEQEGALAQADQMLAQNNIEIESLREKLSMLVSRNVQLEGVLGKQLPNRFSTVSALAMWAMSELPYLDFPREVSRCNDSIESINPKTIWKDLKKLNTVAERWQKRELTMTSFQLACTNEGLSYASSVSDTARQKFEEDYRFELDGKVVLAEAHIRGGQGSSHYRIHIYLDDERQRVVVAYIGKHLRGKRDN